MLVPKPNSAFQSPGDQIAGLNVFLLMSLSLGMSETGLERVSSTPALEWATCGQAAWRSPVVARTARGSAALAPFNADTTADALLTQPRMPPCALIICSPARWNSGKY